MKKTLLILSLMTITLMSCQKEHTWKCNVTNQTIIGHSSQPKTEVLTIFDGTTNDMEEFEKYMTHVTITNTNGQEVRVVQTCDCD